jgi:RNA polymerase sporulation-specific sigma factor
MDFGELISLCHVGLMKAYNTYDPNKGVMFITYATPIMKNEILHRNRINSKHNIDKQCVSMEEPLSFDEEGNSFKIEDVLYDEQYGMDLCDLIVEKQLSESVRRIIMNDLPAGERDVIAERYYHGKTQQEIAISKNMSQSWISRLEKLGLKHIEQSLNKQGWDIPCVCGISKKRRK